MTNERRTNQNASEAKQNANQRVDGVKFMQWTEINKDASFCQVFPHYYAVKGIRRSCVAIGEFIENDKSYLPDLALLLNFTPSSFGDAMYFGRMFEHLRNGGGVFECVDDESIMEHVENIAINDLIKTMLSLNESRLGQGKVAMALKPFITERWIKAVSRALYLRTHKYTGEIPTDPEALRALATKILHIELLAPTQKGAVILAFKDTYDLKTN